MRAKRKMVAAVATVALALSAMAGLPMRRLPSAGSTLSNNVLYVVQQTSSLTVTGGRSGLSVQPNSTVALYIAEGATLSVKGSGAPDRNGAGAGIEVPSSSTLVVTGGGTLEAYGGNGHSGYSATTSSKGEIATSGSNDHHGHGGKGGDGGAGGGGAGAGIGGAGGKGGAGGAAKGSAWYYCVAGWDRDGKSGVDGGSGTAGGTCGTVYLLGNIRVTAEKGTSGGSGGSSSGASGWIRKNKWWWSYRVGGGGGGGGGAGKAASEGIGGGGGGAGGGGSGGGGGCDGTSQGIKESEEDYPCVGGNGGGGKGSPDGGGTRSKGGNCCDGSGYGGNGGYGGSAGDAGGNGTVYKGANVTVTGRSSTKSSDTHDAIKYNLTFSDQYRLNDTKTAKLGYMMPEAPTTGWANHEFHGWFTGRNGEGWQYYDENGIPKFNTLPVPPHTNMWATGNVTLYASWTDVDHPNLAIVTLTVNGIDIVNSVSTNGVGWDYSGETGKLRLFGEGGTYDISGMDLDGMATIEVESNCTIQVSRNLTMDASMRNGRSSLVVLANRKATLDVKEGATCDMTAGSGAAAIRVPTSTALTIKTAGVLKATGGEGAADIGCNSGETSGGTVYVETRSNWAANIRPGHGMESGNGLLNDAGTNSTFRSFATSNKVWSVQVTGLDAGGTQRLYLQEAVGSFAAGTFDDVTADETGRAWLWVTPGDYEWSEIQNATDNDSIWTAQVDTHTRTRFYTALNVTINGEDIAHMKGPGWYSTRNKDHDTMMTLVLTNSGPFVVSGSGNVGIDVKYDANLVISNLMLDVTAWKGKTAIYTYTNGVTLNLTLEGANKLNSAEGRAGIFVGKGNKLTISGDGSLEVNAGDNAAAIGSESAKDRKECGEIYIYGGSIRARGGLNGAGIGNAQTDSTSGFVLIGGGVVRATGGQYGAGIGGGKGGGGVSVYVTGGTIFPTAGAKALAIGCAGVTTNIFGNAAVNGYAAIYATEDAVSPAPWRSDGRRVFPVSFDLASPNHKVERLVLGDETCEIHDMWTDEAGNLTIWLPPTERTTVTVELDDGSAHSFGYEVDDDGNVEFSKDVLLVDGLPVVGGVDSSGTGWVYTGSTSNLVISSGNHSISGMSTNGTIRVIAKGKGMVLTLTDLTLQTPASRLSPFVVSNNCTITLSGANVIEAICNPAETMNNRRGSMYTAGIEVPAGGSLTITGEGQLTAKGGFYGAGIGSRGANTAAGSITIENGYVYATGGPGGAGIGGGEGGTVASILVSGGYVHATGGKGILRPNGTFLVSGACGIGGGNGNTSVLTNGTFRVTGGTVMAEKGSGQVYSDFVLGSGNAASVTHSEAIVIDGGSVRPRNTIVPNLNPYPAPVNSDGKRLVFAMFTGMTWGDEVTVTDGLWPNYQNKTLIADDDGAVCIWGEFTNETRVVTVSSVNLPGGHAVMEVSAWSNTIYSVSESGGTAPESKIVVTPTGDVTCWRVTVPALPAGKRLPVSGLDPAYSRGTTMSDSDGNASVYMPNGEYDFKVDNLSYHASVTGTATTATYLVGITVDGTDVGVGEGTGWTYDWAEETLTLNRAKTFVIAGTNSERRLSVSIAAKGVKVRADRLVLSSSGNAFRVSGNQASLEFVGGTMAAGTISDRIAVSGGSIDATLAQPVSTNKVAKTLYCVKAGGFGRFEKVEVGGLPDYDTEGIYANAAGEIFLYLPEGGYTFTANGRSMAAAVSDGFTVALEYHPTGITVNGHDVALFAGKGWRNDDGVVTLTNTNETYVIAGTNFGEAVSFVVTGKNATLRLCDVVMTNGMGTAAQIGLAANASATIEISGTNILHGVDAGRCAISVGSKASLAVRGSGLLEAVGGPGAAGIGGAGYYTQDGGTVVVTGTDGAVDVGTGRMIVKGGSLHLSNSARSVAATNASAAGVYCVAVPTRRPSAAASELFDDGICGYPLNGALMDADGKLYIWLTNGTYYARIDGALCHAAVAGADTAFSLVEMGVSVDGEDIALGYGNGWTYDVGEGLLSVFGNCRISGAHIGGRVSIVLTNSISVTISNLTLTTGTDGVAAHPALAVAPSANVELTLKGVNRLTCAADGYAGINVPVGACIGLYSDSDDSGPALVVTGGAGAAGIGGNLGELCGRIDLACNVKAQGGFGGAGIGGGAIEDASAVDVAGAGEVSVRRGAMVEATGGWCGAGIGGGSNHCGVAACVYGGLVSARGGTGGAGIGAGFGSVGNRISISGGTVVANGGGIAFSYPSPPFSRACDLGAGELTNPLDVSAELQPLTITNACVHARSGLLTPAASNSVQRVYCLKVEVSETDDVESLRGLPGYEDIKDIYPDGRWLYLWVPDGDYVFFAGESAFVATVAGADAVAQAYRTGIAVDGADIASHGGYGNGWFYDIVEKKLIIFGDCVISGTNTEGTVSMLIGEAANVTAHDLLLEAQSPITADADFGLVGLGRNEILSTGAPVIAGTGTVTFASGTFRLGGDVDSAAVVGGGSLKLDGSFAVAPSNGAAEVFCVTLTNLAAGAKVVLGGLPSYYDASQIYADETGKVYLWLSADWDPSNVVQLLSATAPREIEANGYKYRLAVGADGKMTAEKGGAVELEGFRINGFAVEAGVLTINVSSNPGTWLYGFPEQVIVRSSGTLPIPKTPETVVDLSYAEATMEDDGSVTYSVELPQSESASRFFTVEKR